MNPSFTYIRRCLLLGCRGGGTKVVLSKYPDMSRRKLSPRQLEANRLMEGANQYAQNTISDPGKKDAALLRLKVLENKLYRALIKEYLLKKGEVE